MKFYILPSHDRNRRLGNPRYDWIVNLGGNLYYYIRDGVMDKSKFSGRGSIVCS